MESIALDTNILVRFITQDDSRQTPAVNALIQTDAPFFIADIVLAECIWVLRRGYQWSRHEVHQAIETLVHTTNVILEDEAAALHATTAYRKGGDWADHLIQAKAVAHRCHCLLTLDQELIRNYPDFAHPPQTQV